MFTIVRHVNFREGMLVEIPSLAVSLIIAEFFYKFHSFTLECFAFTAPWFLVGGMLARVSRRAFALRGE
jgi:hypothetical protein